MARFIFVGTLRDGDGRHPLDGTTKCIWSTAGFCFEICKDEKTLYVTPEAVYILLPLSCLLCTYARSFIYLLYLSVCFLLCSPCHPALFAEVLEKTVEGEAAALTKAKTLYKSCVSDRKWA